MRASSSSISRRSASARRPRRSSCSSSPCWWWSQSSAAACGSEATRHGGRVMRVTQRLGFWLLVAVIALLSLFPFYYAVISSLRAGSELFTVAYWPTRLDVSNYLAVFQRQPFGLNILNSLVVAGAVVAVSLALSLTAAYAFGRVAFRGRSALLMTILGVSMFPQVAVLSGMFELVRSFGLYNT